MKIELTTDPKDSDLAVVNRGMQQFERSRFPDLPDESEDIVVAAFARADDGSVTGGILARVYWDGLEIEVLWVAEAQRGQGLASSLLTAVEDFARDKGAVVAFLKTVEATGFYERHGYAIFGVLEDRPIGAKLYHMKKRLDAG